MTIELHDAVNGDGLLDIQGKAFFALQTLNTARLTTVPTQVADYVAQWNLKTGLPLAYAAALEGVPAASVDWQSNSDDLASTLSDSLQEVLRSFASTDAGNDLSIDESLGLLIAQMKSAGAYVTPSVVSATVTAAGGNTSDVAIAATMKRGDGQTNSLALPETITITASDVSKTPQLLLTSNDAESNPLSQAWPAGSGLSLTLLTSGADDSLFPIGMFESTGINVNVPDGWTIDVGTPGTTLFLSAREVQTVVMSGTPTAGYFYLIYTDAASRKWITTPLVYNASGGTVQTALRAIPDLALVEVVTTGTSPNYTHTITFVGVAGNPAQLTSQNQTTGGTLTHATTTSGDSLSFKGRSLMLDSNGTELTKIAAPLNLAADTVYFGQVRLRRTGAAAAGTFKISVTNGFQGSDATDSAGGSNVFTVSASAIPTSSTTYAFSFRVPAALPQPAWLTMGFSVAVTATATIYVDEFSVAAGTELYAGGPFVAAFAGVVLSTVGDSWSLAIANNRAGGIHEWYSRCFGLAGNRLLLPTSGSTLVPESVIS